MFTQSHYAQQVAHSASQFLYHLVAIGNLVKYVIIGTGKNLPLFGTKAVP